MEWLGLTGRRGGGRAPGSIPGLFFARWRVGGGLGGLVEGGFLLLRRVRSQARVRGCLRLVGRRWGWSRDVWRVVAVLRRRVSRRIRLARMMANRCRGGTARDLAVVDL